MGVKSFLSCYYKNKPNRPLLFCRGSNKVKEFFFCQSPVAAFPGGRRTYEGWHDGKQSSWIMNVVFGACLPFDIIGEILAWLSESGNHGKKLLPMRIQNWTSHFCAVFIKLNVDNQYMPITSYGALRKPCDRSMKVFCTVESRVAALDFGMGDVVCDCCSLNS